METILKFFLFFFFNEKILHAQKAQKAQKAQNANKRISDFLPLNFFLKSKKKKKNAVFFVFVRVYAFCACKIFSLKKNK